jgi:hypothetical protein
VVAVLNAVYEGFAVSRMRSGRGRPHDALDALPVALERTRVNWIVDAHLPDFRRGRNCDAQFDIADALRRSGNKKPSDLEGFR